MKLYCATSNAGKLHEFRMLSPAIEPLTGIPPCDETGTTFEENAIEKALYYSGHTDDTVFADDSGLEVDALNGAPGIYSARYAGEGAGAKANNDLLLLNLRNEPNRNARFVCAVAVAQKGKLLGIFRGEVEGEILAAPRGSEGFGYDPLFYYPPFDQSFGEVAAERKFTVSHRGMALHAMAGFLNLQER